MPALASGFFGIRRTQRGVKRASLQLRDLVTSFAARGWPWKVAIAGLCGSVTHTLLMLAKAEFGILDAFQPYHYLQTALNHWTGASVPPFVPWLLSYLNGSTIAGFLFVHLYRHLPGGGFIRGFVAGILGWVLMDVIFFPLLGLGPFAIRLHLGPEPALFSLAMMLAYSIVMGGVFSLIDTDPAD
jgi:Family of unknown function (DUF6789)